MGAVSNDIGSTYLTDILRTFRYYKTLADRAMAQVADGDLHRALDAEGNSIAITAKHVAGNLRSRFSGFLTTDGEKPTRNRDAEFEMSERIPRERILTDWNDGWSLATAALEALTPADLDREVHIRGEAFAVVEALDRSVAHIAYHVGQIVLLAKHFAGPAWTSLTIPKGRSAAFGQGDYKRRASS
jgi:hypothetical protein